MGVFSFAGVNECSV